jgi:hypothetical protein
VDRGESADEDFDKAAEYQNDVALTGYISQAKVRYDESVGQ